VTDAAYDYLADSGYDAAFGARPMRRAIMSRVVNPIAGRVIAGEYSAGDTVVVDASADGGLEFTTVVTAEPVE
jgi:ATP-dependent Clp protease ATP-binding subunit ClpB